MTKNIDFVSIIICSRTATIDTNLSKNIEETIGCNYELIVIDNSKNKYSIFEAYNLGIEKSNSDYLCFIHDDVLFHTNGWGSIINNLFNENKKLGLVGVAGAKVKTKMPSAWWDCHENQKVMHIIQHFPNKEKEKCFFGFEDASNIEVVAIDGVFMAMRKDNCIYFNTKMIGFHNYDLNISFEYKKYGYKIIVTKEILVEHFSLGTLNEAWVNSTFKIHSLYKTLLPLNNQKDKINKNLEVNNAIRFINKCLKFYKNKIAYLVWLQFFLLKPVSKYHIQFWKRTLKNMLCSPS